MQAASHPADSNKLYCLVLTATATAQEAQSLAQGIVEARLGACVQIQPIQSLYRWQGRLCNDSEFRLAVKTPRARYEALERFISAHHSYETPEIVAVPVNGISEPYRLWLLDAVDKDS